METPFASDFRALLAKHGIEHPKFAHNTRAFNPDKPQVLYSGPVYDTDELVAATTALVEGKWAVAGEYVHRFEAEFSKYLNQKESVMVNSGSSADLIMIAAAKKRFGWMDGDKIIVSPVGFPTSISAITLNGLVPVFVDIEWSTLNADNNQIRRVMEKEVQGLYGTIPQVRAILVSPVLGNPPDLDELTEICEHFGLKIIMDGCDSLGSTWRGKHLAEYAVASSCSFFPSHHISTLQGGMISSNDQELIRLARQMISWGRACYCVGAANLLQNGTCGCRFKEWLSSQKGIELDHKYIYETSDAYNLQPLDIQGALGLVQLKKIDAIHAGRRVARNRILRSLSLACPTYTASTLEYANPSWFGVPIICPSYEYKRAFVAHLEAAGIQTRNYFAGNILLHPGYAHLGRAEDYHGANQVLKRVFFIGCHPMLTEAHFSHIEETIKSFKAP